jgi:sulfur carrier protein
VIVELNGLRAELPSGASLSDAVIAAGADPDRRGVAAALDGKVVPRSDWAGTRLRDGQTVEIVRAVQGG